MASPQPEPDEFGSPEYVEPPPPPPPAEESVTTNKNSLGYYLQPFFMYLVLILYVVIITGLLLQQYNHQDNVITRAFWGFIHVINDVFVAWTESEPESE